MDFAEKENKRLSKKMDNKVTSNKEPVWFNTKNEKEELSAEEQKELETLFEEFK